MGGCCSCLTGDEGTSTASSRTPLLGADGVGARKGTLSQSPLVQSPVVPASARQHNPPPQRKLFEASIDRIMEVVLEPVLVPEIDKSFQGQAKLYNEVVGSFEALKDDIRSFKEYFVEDTAGIPVFGVCVKLLRDRCGDATINVERKNKNYIEITYNPKEVSEKCNGNPENSLFPLKHIAEACRHIRDILQRAPQVQSNIGIIIGDEETNRREVMKANLSSEDGVKAMKCYQDNIAKLRKMAAGTDTLHRDVNNKFKELANACKGFFNEDTE